MDILKNVDKDVTRDFKLEFMDDVDKTVMYALIGLDFAATIATYGTIKKLLDRAGISGNFGKSAVAFAIAHKLYREFNLTGAWVMSCERRNEKETKDGEESE